MYAIIDDNGRQFKVTAGDRILIDRPASEDQKVTFDRVLFVGGEGEPRIGTPVVAGVTVSADVIGPIKSKKVRNVKYKRRKGFHKTKGHRQQYLHVQVTAINV